MKARLLYLAGVPASGKSTLFKRLRADLFADAEEFRHGLLRGIKSKDGRLYMLGVFDGSTFEGTDRLSMAVINDTLEWFNGLDSNSTVFVEGDRLFNKRFLVETQANVMIIDAHPTVLAARHANRGDNQTETFLRSRRTKVDNIVKMFKLPVYTNNTSSDSERNYHILKRFAECGK